MITHVDTASNVRVLDKVVGRQDTVVRLDDGFRDFWRGEDGERGQHSVGEFFSDLAEKQSSET